MPAALLLVSFLDCASPRQKCECREKLARDELIRVRAGVVDRARVSAVVLGPYASHYPRFRTTVRFPRFELGRGSSNASAYRRRTITRMSISTWANGTGSAVPTARPDSASIHDWDRSRPIRQTVNTSSDSPTLATGDRPQG
jgi:hypothetical protein